MKNILAFALLFIGFSSFAQQASFEKKGLQFSDVKEGTILEFNYYFTNTGSRDLIFNQVKPTCGCTIAEFPKGPIKPGQRDSIQVQFNSEGRVGYNAKGVNIMSNIGEINLVFEADVVPNNATDALPPEEE